MNSLFAMLISLAALVGLSLATQSAIPGMSVALSQASIDSIIDKTRPRIEQQVRALKIPDVSKKIHVPIVGSVKFKLSKIRFTDFHIQNLNTRIVTSQGLHLSSAIKLAIHANYHYRMHLVSGGGHVKMSTRINVGMMLKTFSDSNQHLGLNMDYIYVHTYGLKTDASGWIVDALLKLFNEQLKDSIESAIRSQLNASVNSVLQSMMREIDYNIPVGNKAANVFVDLTVPDVTPYGRPPSIVLGIKGLFYQRNGLEYPGPPAPVVTHQPAQAEIIVTDLTFNSLGWAWYQSSKLVKSFYQDDLPIFQRFMLNTKAYYDIAPKLAEKYPETQMILHLNMTGTNFTTSPLFELTDNGIRVVTRSESSFRAMLPDGNVAELFSLDTELTADFKVGIEENKLVGSMRLSKATLTLLRSSVGEVKVEQLEKRAFLMLSLIVIPLVEKDLKKGFDIPTINGLQLLNPKLFHTNQYVRIQCDVDYIP